MALIIDEANSVFARNLFPLPYPLLRDLQNFPYPSPLREKVYTEDEDGTLCGLVIPVWIMRYVGRSLNDAKLLRYFQTNTMNLRYDILSIENDVEAIRRRDDGDYDLIFKQDFAEWQTIREARFHYGIINFIEARSARNDGYASGYL